MSKVKRLLHTRYRVDDLERTVRFYRDVLGLEEVRRHKSPRGSELVFLKAPDSEEQLELCRYAASGPVQVQPDLTHLAFEVASLEDFGRHLARLGLSTRMDLTSIPTAAALPLLTRRRGMRSS
jgi:lactoylglutathione lyase